MKQSATKHYDKIEHSDEIILYKLKIEIEIYVI